MHGFQLVFEATCGNKRCGLFIARGWVISLFNPHFLTDHVHKKNDIPDKSAYKKTPNVRNNFIVI